MGNDLHGQSGENPNEESPHGAGREEKMLRQWLLDIRKAKKLSQAHIAQLSGITQSAYARIEIGSRDPSIRVAKQIGKILDFPWTKFFE